MSIMRGNDWRGFRGELDRLFDDFFRSPGRLQQGEGGGQSIWAPAVDISEDKDNYLVHAELPGVNPDEVSIELENNVLSIRGERRFERRDEQENYHFVERSYGSFYRSFSLPRNVDVNNVNANFDNGVLMITIPKAEEAKPRKVQIGAGDKGKEIPATGKTMTAGGSQ